MFRITAIARTLPAEVGSIAPQDIEAEFRRRDWHKNPRSWWDGSALRLTVENDFDADGRATLDEFADAPQICLDFDGDIDFEIESVERF